MKERKIGKDVMGPELVKTKRRQNPSWYNNLITDLKKLCFGGIVCTKHAIGKRILQDELKFGKPEYGSKRIENLAKDLDTSADDLWACMRFAKKFKNLDSVQQFSWRHIWHKLLPAPKPDKPEMPEFPQGKYGIIYADPPWKYYEGGYKNQSQHYDTLAEFVIQKLKDKKKRPITDLSADNCILFLWVTFPVLDGIFDIIKAWGFQYSTCGFVWVKSKKDGTGFAFGCGSWTRANVELCLIAKKGKIKRQNTSISQIIYEPKAAHSKKPEIVRDKIIQLVGDLPRIELFARQKTKGWDVWGKEI